MIKLESALSWANTLPTVLFSLGLISVNFDNTFIVLKNSSGDILRP